MPIGGSFYPDFQCSLVRGLTAYYKLEEASGIRVDAFGSNDLGPQGAPGNITGIYNSAVALSSSLTQLLAASDNAAISFNQNSFTLAAWFYMDSKVGDDRNILAKTVNGGVPTTEYALFWTPSALKFRIGDGSSVTAVSSGVDPDLATWYFMIGWHDAVGDTINVQINNGAVNSSAWSTGSQDTASPLEIGRGGSSGAALFNGRIDEVGLWGRVLNAQERSDLYNGGIGNTYSAASSCIPKDPESTVSTF